MKILGAFAPIFPTWYICLVKIKMEINLKV